MLRIAIKEGKLFNQPQNWVVHRKHPKQAVQRFSHHFQPFRGVKFKGRQKVTKVVTVHI